MIASATVTNNNSIFLCFRSCFPFGRPEGALKATLSLMERVWSLLQYYMSEHAIWQCLNIYFYGQGFNEGYNDTSATRRGACSHKEMFGKCSADQLQQIGEWSQSRRSVKIDSILLEYIFLSLLAYFLLFCTHHIGFYLAALVYAYRSRNNHSRYSMNIYLLLSLY